MATHSKRPPQPRCARVQDGGSCNHALSFHSGKEGAPCRALGCHCPGFLSVAKADSVMPLFKSG